MEIKKDLAIDSKFNNYPPIAREKLLALRKLILETASEIESIKSIEETLKWGEPSYLVKKGSTLRIDWKSKAPDQYAMYFKCTSKLIPTIRSIFKDKFEYEKNRAIVFKMDDTVPAKELKTCIKFALTYHQVKELPNLGYSE